MASYITLMTEEVPQGEYELLVVKTDLRWLECVGVSRRRMSHKLPPWATVSQLAQRWFKAGVFAMIVADLVAVLQL